MKHHDCACGHCRPPASAQGVLLPRIIARGRTWLHRHPCTLQVEDLPACLQPPLTLTCLTPCGEPRWEPLGGSQSLRYRVCIPLVCQVQDACGCTHTGQASITAEVCLTPLCPLSECWRACVLMLPCVRLLCAACAASPCFDVQLELLLEGYLLRWEACLSPAPCKPQCPDLPLYPQPCRL